MSEEKVKADWVKIKPVELEKVILELHNQGNSSAKIGLILRDKHGVPKAKLLGKRIGQILVENKSKVVSEKELVKGKMENLDKHIGKHKHDYTAKRSLTKKLWIVNKLNKQEAAAQ